MARLTVSDAARVTGVSRMLLYRYIKAGKLSRTPDGLLDTAELLRAGLMLQTSDVTTPVTLLHDVTAASVTPQAPTLSRYTSCSASMKEISPSPSSKHSPQIKRASGFAQAFCPHSGQVNFVLLDFFALPCSLAGTDCQWS